MAEDISGDDRIIRETGLDARVAGIVRPVIAACGYRLVRVRLSGQNGLTLQIMAERPDGTMDVDGCEEVSRAVSPALDVDDPIDRAYHLEISSPGIDRPLVRKRDYERFLGHEAKVELLDMINGRKRFRGDIAAVDDEGVTIRLPDAPGGADPDHKLLFSTIAEAKLVMTDKLMDMARADQELHPIDDDETETVEYADADNDDENLPEEKN